MMAMKAILYPMLALVALTAVVAVTMYRRRVAEMRSRRVHPQKLALSAQTAAALQDTRAADNFRNLFEAPVLFYVAALTVYATQLTGPLYVALAWAYVATRIAHSAIQCTYNRVMHRFVAFAGGLLVVFTIFGLIALDLIVANRG
jgi:hypothetical protein